MLNSILYCKCIYTEYISSVDKDLFEAILKSSNNELIIIDDLCRRVAENTLSKESLEKKGLVVIACHPRAVRWLLAAAGIPDDIWKGIHFFNIYKTPWTDIFNFLECNLNDIEKNKISIIQKKLQTLNENDKPEESPEIEKKVAIASSKNSKRPWFPVIDYGRCKNCGACMDFCLFGVYNKNNKQEIEVENPFNCKDNCPACARVCPHNAIIFPKYDKAPINGDLKGNESESTHKPPIFSLSGDELYKALSGRKKVKTLYKD